MAVTDKKCYQTAAFPRKVLVIPVQGLTASGSVSVAKFTPGFAFQVVAASLYCSANTNLTNVDVQIGSTSVLSSAIAPTSGSEVAGTLSSTLANVRGTSTTSQLNIVATAGTTLSVTNGVVMVVIRPYPLDNEA